MIIFKRIRNIKFAIAGILHAFKNDISFRLEVLVGLPVVALIVYFGQPLSELEITLLVLGYALILITELQNSALESALDRLHPELHDQIGQSKDMAAGAVFLAGLFAVGVAMSILWL